MLEHVGKVSVGIEADLTGLKAGMVEAQAVAAQEGARAAEAYAKSAQNRRLFAHDAISNDMRQSLRDINDNESLEKISRGFGRISDSAHNATGKIYSVASALKLLSGAGIVGAAIGAFSTIYAAIEKLSIKLEEIASKPRRIASAIYESTAAVEKSLQDLDSDRLSNSMSGFKKYSAEEVSAKRVLLDREFEDRKEAARKEASERAENRIKEGQDVEESFKQREAELARFGEALDKERLRRWVQIGAEAASGRASVAADIEARSREEHQRDVIAYLKILADAEEDRSQKAKRNADEINRANEESARRVRGEMEEAARVIKSAFDPLLTFLNSPQSGGQLGASAQFVGLQLREQTALLQDLKTTMQQANPFGSAFVGSP